jgi:hypothetical protein
MVRSYPPSDVGQWKRQGGEEREERKGRKERWRRMRGKRVCRRVRCSDSGRLCEGIGRWWQMACDETERAEGKQTGELCYGRWQTERERRKTNQPCEKG